MTTLLPPAPGRRTGAPGTVAPTGPAGPPEQRRLPRLGRLAALVAAAVGTVGIPFGAPVSPMAVSRLVRYRPDGPAR